MKKKLFRWTGVAASIVATAAMGLAACGGGEAEVDGGEPETPATSSVFTVTFDANKGTFPSDVTTPVKLETGENGTLAAFPTKDPTRASDEQYDYSFLGWTLVADTGDVLKLSHIYDKDTTVYAKWDKKSKQTSSETEDTTYTVTFHANGGSYADEKDEVEVKTDKNGAYVAPTDPTRDEFTFLGYTASQNDKTNFIDMEDPDPVSEDTDLWAQWKAVDPGVDDTNDIAPSNFTLVGSMNDWTASDRTYVFVDSGYDGTPGENTITDQYVCEITTTEKNVELKIFWVKGEDSTKQYNTYNNHAEVSHKEEGTEHIYAYWKAATTAGEQDTLVLVDAGTYKIYLEFHDNKDGKNGDGTSVGVSQISKTEQGEDPEVEDPSESDQFTVTVGESEIKMKQNASPMDTNIKWEYMILEHDFTANDILTFKVDGVAVTDANKFWLASDSSGLITEKNHDQSSVQVKYTDKYSIYVRKYKIGDGKVNVQVVSKTYPTDPVEGPTAVEVGSDTTHLWVVGKVDGIMDWDVSPLKGIQGSENTTNNDATNGQYKIERVYLKVGDVFKLYVGGEDFGSGNHYTSDLVGLLKGETVEGLEWTSGEGSDIKVTKEGYYSFYLNMGQKNAGNLTGKNVIWTSYSAT